MRFLEEYQGMYTGTSFSWQYAARCEKREKKRKRVWKFCLITLVAVCIICLSVLLLDRILGTGVFTIAGRETAEYEVQEEPALVQENITLGNLPAAEEKQMPTVFVDAGHGGADGGSVVGDVIEKDINLAIALAVRRKLEASGYAVLMAREGDAFVGLQDRVKAANDAGADIYVSIHQNEFKKDKSVCGMEVWYKGEDTKRDSKRLAELIQQQTIKSTGASERELRDDADFLVTGSTLMPACLIETGFISNKAERELLVTKAYQEQIAQGIVQGIEYYFHPELLDSQPEAE